MVKKIFFLLLLISISANSQITMDKNMLFSEAIGLNIKKYTHDSQKAYHYQNYERANFLYDSLVDNVIKGSYLDNFEVRKLSGRKIELYKFKKPIFLITYSSWCTPAEGEIPTLNKIAKKYYKNIDFVVLFWDTKSNAKKSSKKYSRKVNILYVDEMENTHNHIIGKMKHSLGLPTSFLINKDKRIIAIKRGAKQFYKHDAQSLPEAIYKYFIDGVSSLTKLSEEDKNFSSNYDSSTSKVKHH